MFYINYFSQLLSIKKQSCCKIVWISLFFLSSCQNSVNLRQYLAGTDKIEIIYLKTKQKITLANRNHVEQFVYAIDDKNVSPINVKKSEKIVQITFIKNKDKKPLATMLWCINKGTNYLKITLNNKYFFRKMDKKNQDFLLLSSKYPKIVELSE